MVDWSSNYQSNGFNIAGGSGLEQMLQQILTQMAQARQYQLQAGQLSGYMPQINYNPNEDYKAIVENVERSVNANPWYTGIQVGRYSDRGVMSKDFWAQQMAGQTGLPRVVWEQVYDRLPTKPALAANAPTSISGLDPAAFNAIVKQATENAVPTLQRQQYEESARLARLAQLGRVAGEYNPERDYYREAAEAWDEIKVKNPTMDVSPAQNLTPEQLAAYRGTWASAAADRLGISNEQATRMFDRMRTIEQRTGRPITSSEFNNIYKQENWEESAEEKARKAKQLGYTTMSAGDAKTHKAQMESGRTQSTQAARDLWSLISGPKPIELEKPTKGGK